MTYRGYAARVEYDPAKQTFVGRVTGVTALLEFQGNSVKALETNFHAAVNRYLADCKKRGQEPEKAFSGKLMLRVPPEVHAKIAAAAARSRKSINAYVADIFAASE